MRSFSKIILSVAVIFLFVLGLNKVSRYLYEPSTNSIIFERDDLEKSEGTIENLFLGTSLVHAGIDPQVISDKLDSVSYNMGTSMQPLSGSYYLLKDQIIRNPIKRVFLGIGIASLNADSSQYTNVKMGTFDRISSLLVKAQYLIDVAEFKEYEQLMFYPARVENLFNRNLIEENIAYKSSEDFENRIRPDDSETIYYGMGFENTNEVFSGRYNRTELDSDGVWNRDSIREENLEYLRKIAALCEKKGIELNIMILPHPEVFANLQGDLADMDAYMEELCQELGARLFDYNYTACENVYELFPNEYYRDKKHLNRTGAAAFSTLLCEEYLAGES